MCDGMEITQFTYFQQAGGMELNPNSLEITYGIERLAMFLDNKNNMYDLEWGNKVSYADLNLEAERQFSIYNFEVADIDLLRNGFQLYQQEAERLVEQRLLPAGLRPGAEVFARCSTSWTPARPFPWPSAPPC